MKILVTGVAGFIGCHVALRLLKDGHEVIGLDNLNSCYDVRLKKSRLDLFTNQKQFKFFQFDIADAADIHGVFNEQCPSHVVHLAAQAGVRYSLERPEVYIQSNINGFLNILEACRKHSVQHLVYASSSSIYGANTQMPFSTHQNVDHPISLYAATKKANELMAHTYSHLFQIPTTGLRFFTVYGPWGRPDMALFLFTRAILEGKPIDVYHHGKMKRDFTYIDDIVEGVVRVLNQPATPNPNWSSAKPDPATSKAPYRLYNIGNNRPVELDVFIETIEKVLDRKAIKNYLPLQPGDVPETWADIDDLIKDTGFKAQTLINDGIARFIEWYKNYYKIR